MRLRLDHLELTCKRATYKVPFASFSYFYGEMGAGKSTIARLIDYCFGGGLEMTPALQSEFVSAALELTINDVPLRVERSANANQVFASWGVDEGRQQLILPARAADGEVLTGTGVEVLSDLIFHLAGIKPPMIRRNKTRDEAGLERLSFRDLFWYCYLDQDSIDNSFFHLDGEADVFKRRKSRAVLGYLLGYNQQRVAELESELEEVRSDRIGAAEAAEALEASLKEAGIESDVDISVRLTTLASEKGSVERSIATLREDLKASKSHITERLTDRARQLVSEVMSVREAIAQVETNVGQHRRHRNELLSLSTKFQRVTSARAVLDGVAFVRCPRCTQSLPHREDEKCALCGQADAPVPETVVATTEADLASRQSELEEVIRSQQEQLRVLRVRESRLSEEKERVDTTLAAELEQYDSAYLSQVLDAERRLAAVNEESRFLERLRALPIRVESLKKKADQLKGKESGIRRDLKEARAAAEKDLTNLRLLGELFLDCLVRSKLAGFTSEDIVSLSSPSFLPSITDRSSGATAVTSFDTIGSGGKKTLFKCCFAVAVHRMAQRVGSVLPKMLVIDSPMKNISERENRAQFEGFHAMLYELAASELQDVQFVMIDKEFCPPSADIKSEVHVRHMTVDNADAPPLIEYFRERAAGSASESQVDSSEQADDKIVDDSPDHGIAE